MFSVQAHLQSFHRVDSTSGFFLQSNDFLLILKFPQILFLDPVFFFSTWETPAVIYFRLLRPACLPANTITALSPAATINESTPPENIFNSMLVLADPGPMTCTVTSACLPSPGLTHFFFSIPTNCSPYFSLHHYRHRAPLCVIPSVPLCPASAQWLTSPVPNSSASGPCSSNSLGVRWNRQAPWIQSGGPS